MTRIALENISLEINGVCVLKDVSFSLGAGEFVALVGPNGAGKSSLMKCALGAAAPTLGRAMIGDEDAAAMNPATRARRIAYLPQIRPTVWPLLVEDIVALGRYAYGVGTKRSSSNKDDAVEAAIAACGLERLRLRPADMLSGGELARVHCARAFAAQAPLLLADEPTNSLDPAGQMDILNLIRTHVANGAGALVILHDLNLAATFADRMVWMANGEIVADGPPRDTVSEQRINEVFGVEARVRDRDDALSVVYNA